MKIYHGTSSQYLEKILRKGLIPRGRRKGNFKQAPSHPQMVYLSIAYPFYFAIGATQGKHKPIVLEVETDYLDAYNLYPDEDFLHDVLQHQRKPIPKSLRDDLPSYQHHWRDSLNALGNCCHHGVIQPTAITRYCVFDPSQRVPLTSLMLDPSISIMNFSICKTKYCGLVEWMFGDRATLPDDEFMLMLDSQVSPEVRQFIAQRKQFWTEQAQDRTGIEVYPFRPISTHLDPS